jgi:uncharacterized membrane protein YGL010W
VMAAQTRENRFLTYLADYASYHQTTGNQRTHLIGIPVITATILGMLAHVSFGPSFAGGLVGLDLGLLLWATTTVWYLSMDWRIGLPSSAVGFLLYLVGRALPIPVLIALFVIGWIIQYIGHLHYEHNKPAFYKNFEHLLIGPVWVIGKVFRFLPPLPQAAPPANA